MYELYKAIPVSSNFGIENSQRKVEKSKSGKSKTRVTDSAIKYVV